jgi:hypothetical protein
MRCTARARDHQIQNCRWWLAEYHNTSWAREIYDASRKMTTKALSLTWFATLSRGLNQLRVVTESGENGKQRLFWQFHTRARSSGHNF